MQVILLQDVKGIGRAGEVAKVSDGHGRNYLIPRKMAMEATPANLKTLERRKQEIEARREVDQNRAAELKEQIEGKTVRLVTKAGEGGRLFGAVTSKDITDVLEKDFSIVIDKKKVIMDAPIKQVGLAEVEIKLFPGISALCKVDVIAQ
ncbi:MAG: 50S ribosomal protein L9 [Bacillota bacterium]|jgi:large subunit ribosomal protein L9|nr:50S ribosomal protein L9 [Eubacteriales bacterium]MDI9491453.1 50S ribosomal protein L9 [Bacillota bacterium]NLV70551.1 50S ribosomal protein L9 [Clostridiales bacterium]MDD3536892.1 50S ribosomal protein L9 [Eubacteriales bacterium]MDD4285994.1 50S ribosomal protein L9 [Eubacteriales bacterium]